MEPLRVTAHLQTPVVVTGRHYHFDALIAYAEVQEALSQGLSEADALVMQDSLPIEKSWSGADWVYCSSVIQWEQTGGITMTRYIKRNDPVTAELWQGKGVLHTRKDALSVGSGHYRAYDLRAPTIWARTGTAWVIGDRQRIVEALQSIVSLGKLRRNGYGRVNKWTVEPDLQALTVWQRRSLPLGFIPAEPEQYAKAVAGLRPPYWDRVKHQECLQWIG